MGQRVTMYVGHGTWMREREKAGLSRYEFHTQDGFFLCDSDMTNVDLFSEVRVAACSAEFPSQTWK